MTSTTKPRPPSKPELGLLGLIGVLVGAGCVLFAILGVANTAFELDLALRVYGAAVEVPGSYEVCGGVAAAGVVIAAFSFFGSRVIHRLREAKGRPWLRVGIVVCTVALLSGAGYGLYVWAILDTYGSFLAYYATDGDLDDLRAELDNDPSPEDLDRAVSRAAQYDNAEALELLLEAGADMRQATMSDPRCPLGGDVGADFVRTALEHGVGPSSCPNSEGLIYDVVRSAQDDDEAATLVEMLRAAGWSSATPPDARETPAELAARRGLTATAAALQ